MSMRGGINSKESAEARAAYKQVLEAGGDADVAIATLARKYQVTEDIMRAHCTKNPKSWQQREAEEREAAKAAEEAEETRKNTALGIAIADAMNQPKRRGRPPKEASDRAA